MRQRRSLMHLVATGLLALALRAALLGYGTSYFDSEFQPLNQIGLTASGVLMGFCSFVFGLPVVALYGVPVFTVLENRGKASWVNVLAAAVFPCIVAAAFAWQLGVLIAGFAFPVAVAMRAIHGAGPNNSFKPNPHQVR